MGSNSSREIGNNNTSRRSNGRSSSKQQAIVQEYVDYGTTLPNGLYKAQQDYNIKNVRKLIRERKLSPFYKGFNDPPESRPEDSNSSPQLPQTTTITNNTNRPRNNSVAQEDLKKRTLYNNPVECPICFLYYPSNINHSRCCDQPICTECFLQIKRPIETPSLPAACPFCMEDNFGIIYELPAWSDKYRTVPTSPQSTSSSNNDNDNDGSKDSPRHTTSGVSDGMVPRRKSINHHDPDVVLVDHVRPNWREAPVRTGRSRHNSESRGSNNNNSNGFLRVASPLFTRPGRSASSAAHSDYHHYLAAMRDMNLDLEEYMVMEAIRMSLAEQEQQQERGTDNNSNNNIDSSSTTNINDNDNDNRNDNGDGSQEQNQQRQSPPITENNNNSTSLTASHDSS
ncbi:hypothetical protein INT45_012943 [Circinella minor]|uniref:RING-type domain-containing protein n=1 Tax=Circinella minor TaxID=1195481 RepID=A0A8H7VJL9_9FUNG|nr:hypothetical protein INT45_012943 [Circinella minor]